MDKLIINHFVKNPKFSNGVTNYIKELNGLLQDSYDVLNKPYSMNMAEFRTYIANFLGNDAKKFDVIECAESQSACLYLSNEFNIHVRMHCPYFLFKKVIREKPDENRFSDEVRGMYKAKAVSSPSYGMLSLLKNELDINKIHVYKNPIHSRLTITKDKFDKNIDVVLLSRFNKLKGNEFIDRLIKLLPSDYNIVIAGKQEEKICLTENYPNVTILDHIEGDEKFDLLANAHVAISLSKFENCSMAILEALSVGTPVVSWDVGGNAELAPPSVLRVAQLGNLNEFARLIVELRSTTIEVSKFERVLESLNEDFVKGVTHVERYIKGEEKEIYKGLSFINEHDKLETIPEILPTFDENSQFPVNVLCATGTLAAARFFDKQFNDINSSINMNIAYQGPYYSQIKNICKYNIEKNLVNPNGLINAIKKSKAEVLIVDDSYPMHINDIYELKTKLKITVLYSEKSVIIDNSYSLNKFGFGTESNLFFSKVNQSGKIIKTDFKKALVWAKNIQNINLLNTDKLLYLSSLFEEVDIVGDLNLFDNLVNVSQVSEKNIDYSQYCSVLSCVDDGLAEFFDYENSIFILNENSIYKNKNIDVNTISKGFIESDVGSRALTVEFLSSYDCILGKNGVIGLFQDSQLEGLK